MTREEWYNSLSDKEISSLQFALENRMILQDASQKEAEWEKLLNEQYNRYLQDIENKKRMAEYEEQRRKEEEEQHQRDLALGIATLKLYTSNKYRTWVAEITGTDEKYGFKRNFINPFDTEGNFKIYHLKEGKLYNFLRNNEQVFARVENSRIIEMSKFEMLELLSK